MRCARRRLVAHARRRHASFSGVSPRSRPALCKLRGARGLHIAGAYFSCLICRAANSRRPARLVEMPSSATAAEGGAGGAARSAPKAKRIGLPTRTRQLLWPLSRGSWSRTRRCTTRICSPWMRRPRARRRERRRREKHGLGAAQKRPTPRRSKKKIEEIRERVSRRLPTVGKSPKLRRRRT